MGVAATLVRGAFGAALKKQGVAPGGAYGVPLLEALPRRVVLEEARIQRYERACGIDPPAEQVPPAYPEALFLGPMAELATARGFPLSPLGLIHVRQTVAPRRAIPRNAALDLCCRIAEARDVPQGIEVDMAMEARMDGTVAWEGTATVLSRNARTRGRSSAGRQPSTTEPPTRGLEITAGPRTGLDYAAATGDYNPHHLYPWTARLLGYRRPIAHGMWTLARALDLLHGARALTPPYGVEATFKRPLFLPGRSVFHIDDTPERTRFEVRDARDGAPQLLGTARW
jgi:acyl dehydratase